MIKLKNLIKCGKGEQNFGNCIYGYNGYSKCIFVNIQVADIEPFYFTLMINFLIIGIMAFLFLRILCPKWKLGFTKIGLIDGFKKYGIIGVAVAIVGFIAFYVGLSPFDRQPSIVKVLIEGVIFLHGLLPTHNLNLKEVS